MNDDDRFDMSELRSMQLEAIEYCLRQDILGAKVKYLDAIRRIDYKKIRYVTRECNMVLNITLGIVPFCFTEN